jgi:hypothetical protein
MRNSSTSDDERRCRTAGCERGPMPMQVATQLQKARDRSDANTVRTDAEEPASFSVRVQAVRLRSGSRDCRAVKLLSTQIVRKQAKAIFHLQQRGTLHATSSSTLSNITNGWLTWQRRSYSEDDPYLSLHIHRCVKQHEFIGDSCGSPVEIECITAGKSVRLQQELCAHRRTLFARCCLRWLH